MNTVDIFDMVVDSQLVGKKLPAGFCKAISERMYVDRRGGDFAWLWGSDEFVDALDWNLSNG